MSEFPKITTKEQATDRVNIRIGKTATELINAIEKKLATEWVPGSRVIIYPKELLETTSHNKRAIINTVLAMYESSGWEASYNSSQRDGDWIEIK